MITENPEFFHASLALSDVVSAIILFVGTIFLAGVLKVFLGSRLKTPAVMIGAGLLFHAALHEVGEFLFRSGIHGGVPKTLFGSVHVVLFGIIGAIVFFIGCYMLNKRYSDYLEAG